MASTTRKGLPWSFHRPVGWSVQWEKVWLFTRSFRLCPTTFPSVLLISSGPLSRERSRQVSVVCVALLGECLCLSFFHGLGNLRRSQPRSLPLARRSCFPRQLWNDSPNYALPAGQMGTLLISLNRLLMVELGCAAQWEAAESHHSGVISRQEEGAGQTTPSRKRRLRPENRARLCLTFQNIAARTPAVPTRKAVYFIPALVSPPSLADSALSSSALQPGPCGDRTDPIRCPTGRAGHVQAGCLPCCSLWPVVGAHSRLFPGLRLASQVWAGQHFPVLIFPKESSRVTGSDLPAATSSSLSCRLSACCPGPGPGAPGMLGLCALTQPQVFDGKTRWAWEVCSPPTGKGPAHKARLPCLPVPRRPLTSVHCHSQMPRACL